MRNGKSDVKLDLEPNSKPYLLKRIISDGFDTVLIFVLFMILSAVIFSSPLANVYNAHYENFKKVEDNVTEEYGNDAEAITEALTNDAYYREERFAANLHAYLLKLLAGSVSEAAVLLAVPLISKLRGTPGKLLTGIIPFSEKRQTKVPALTIAARFLYIFILDSAILYLFTGIYTFLLVAVFRFLEMLVNKKNKTICDAVTGTMIIEKLSYNGIDMEEKT